MYWVIHWLSHVTWYLKVKVIVPFPIVVLKKKKFTLKSSSNLSAFSVDVLGGYNGTIFAYGQTSSGKTHTMEVWRWNIIQGSCAGFYSVCLKWIKSTIYHPTGQTARPPKYGHHPEDCWRYLQPYLHHGWKPGVSHQGMSQQRMIFLGSYAFITALG